MEPNATDGKSPAAATRGVEAHEVTSEVALELQQVDRSVAGTAAVTRDENALQLLVVRPRTVVPVDDDGDLLVPRRRPRKRNKGPLETSRHSSLAASGGDDDDVKPDDMFVLEAQGCSAWEAAGTQLWRAALLLAEYIHASPELFAGHCVLELGCGIGFASIVASRLARCVFASDADTGALRLGKRNAERNHHGDLRFRKLDWDADEPLALHLDASSDEFDWTLTDQDEVKALDTIIARVLTRSYVKSSDVFYDDATTVAFLYALRGLMRRHAQAKAFVTLERRTVFSATAMRVVSLGYDTFQEHICSHDPANCHSRISENQVRCHECTTTIESACKTTGGLGGDDESDKDLLRFVVHQVPMSQIPQRFQYDRLPTLMLWVIDAVVTP